MYGYKPNENFHKIFTDYHKTHNQAVFDAYTPEMMAARHTHIVTGLPDTYGRGRIVGDYRRIALYGIDQLIAWKQEDKANCGDGNMYDDVIRQREELTEQIRRLQEMKVMAQSYGYDISKPASSAKEAVQWLYFGYLAAIKTQNGAAMSVGRVSTLLDLENFDVAALGEGTAAYYHLLVEATKEAFADRDRWLTDPAFLDIPLKFLLSPEHGRNQAARISMEKAAQHVQPMDPAGDTIWLGVVDRKGCAVSLIQSIYHDFGSAIVPGDTGIILQNRGSFFSLDPGHVNCLQPGKRTFHTLNPAMLLRDGRPELVYGTMGGEGQPQTQAALVTRMIDFGMTPQEAIDAPRWLYGRTWGADSNDLRLEGRIPDEVVCGLARRGHPVKKVGDYTDVMGHAGAILVNQETGVLQGGSDPRGDGLACGY